MLVRWCLVAAVLTWSGQAAAVTTGDNQHDQTRGVLEDAYLKQYQQRPSVYQSAPVSHVVPQLKTITFALEGASYNITVKDDANGKIPLPGSTQSLKLTGYSVAPYIAVSLKRIGLGFSADKGMRKVAYQMANEPAYTYSSTTQSSSMNYTAVGVYGYFIPFETSGKHAITASLVVGAKNYNVTDDVSPIMPLGRGTPGDTRFRYNLTEYEAGALIDYRLLKIFSLVPWINYNYIDIHDPVNQADSVLKASGAQGGSYIDPSTAASLKGDSYLFWRARPRVNGGLDMVLHIYEVDIHFGQAFGLLVTSQNNQNIVDRSYSLSLSFNMKERS